MTALDVRTADAARARAAQITQRSHRPRERHIEGGTPERAAVLFRSQITLRSEQDATVHFHGLASSYEQPYEMYDMFGPYTEVVSHGAASKTLARADLDVPLVLQHDPMRRIARTTNGTLALAETSRGLEVDAPTLDMQDADVAYIVPKLRSGLIDEMSFAFRIIRGQWSPDYTEYRIDEFDLHRGDVAIVAYGANPNTSGTLRTQSGGELIRESETRMLLHI